MLHVFRSLAMVLVMVLAGGATPSLALEDDPAAARSHFAMGTRLYEVGEYRQALDEFKAAHLAKPDPAFLYNIAQCHRQLGDLDLAATMYRRYLVASPNAKNRTEVEKRVAEIEADLAAGKQQSPEPVRAPVPEPVGPSPAEPPPLPAVQAANPVSSNLIQVSSEPKPARSIFNLRVLRWVGVGVTGALVVGAITTGVLARSKYNDLKGSCGKTPEGCSSGDMDGVKSRALASNVLWGLAGAAAIGTGVMFYMTPHEASAQLAWRF
jgi:tetratricopeptide (TPR) repeat protein